MRGTIDDQQFIHEASTDDSFRWVARRLAVVAKCGYGQAEADLLAEVWIQRQRDPEASMRQCVRRAGRAAEHLHAAMAGMKQDGETRKRVCRQVDLSQANSVADDDSPYDSAVQAEMIAMLGQFYDAVRDRMRKAPMGLVYLWVVDAIEAGFSTPNELQTYRGCDRDEAKRAYHAYYRHSAQVRSYWA